MATSGQLEVRTSAIRGAGRGLFALVDFSAGDVVLSVPRPLVAELNDQHLADSCSWCLERAATDPMERAQAASMMLPSGIISVKACTGCRRVSYCSKQCHSKAVRRLVTTPFDVILNAC